MSIKLKATTNDYESYEVNYQKKLLELKEMNVDSDYIKKLLIIVNSYYSVKCQKTQGFLFKNDRHNPANLDFSNCAILCLLKIFTNSSLISDPIIITSLQILILRMFCNGTEGCY